MDKKIKVSDYQKKLKNELKTYPCKPWKKCMGRHFIHEEDFLFKTMIRFGYLEGLKLFCRLYVKTWQSDFIFWDSLNMPDNAKEPESLRSVGAFVAPEIEIGKLVVPIESFDDINHENISKLFNLINKCKDDFINKINTEFKGNYLNYVVKRKQEEPYFKETVYILTLIEYGHYDKAIQELEKSIAMGNNGCFINVSLTLYDGLLAYCKERRPTRIKKIKEYLNKIINKIKQ